MCLFVSLYCTLVSITLMSARTLLFEITAIDFFQPSVLGGGLVCSLSSLQSEGAKTNFVIILAALRCLYNRGLCRDNYDIIILSGVLHVVCLATSGDVSHCCSSLPLVNTHTSGGFAPSPLCCTHGVTLCQGSLAGIFICSFVALVAAGFSTRQKRISECDTVQRCLVVVFV
jgi:hypothetical protein